jgi:hypothetical protein
MKTARPSSCAPGRRRSSVPVAASPATPTLERHIHRAIHDYLTVALPVGSIVWTIPGGDGARTMAPRYRKGSPDIVFAVGGRTYAVEVKGARGKMSPEQIAECNRCAAAAVPYGEVRSVDDMANMLFRWGIEPRASIAGRGRAG